MTPDDPLGRELRQLPRFTARTGFRERLLARLEETDPAPGSQRWRWVPVAAVIVVAVAAGLVAARFGPWGPGGAPGGAPVPLLVDRFTALELERRALAAELRALQDLAETGPPVVYVGGDDTMDLVLDLERLAAERPVNPEARLVPAANRAVL